MAACEKITTEAENHSQMSQYFSTLSNNAKIRYTTKLEYCNRTKQLPDPYSICSGWTDDPGFWPDITFGDIYTYLIDTPGMYTRESLKAYKSLQAYQYVVSGHVKVVLCNNIVEECPFCVVKTSVTPSQRLSDKPHQPWAYLEKATGSVYCGHCTCMAGLGEVCSHVAALLFKMEMGVKLGLTTKSSTSVACEWNKTFRKDKMPVCTLRDDYFRKFTTGITGSAIDPVIPVIQPVPIAESQDVLKGSRKTTITSVSGTGQALLPSEDTLLELKKVCPKAVFFDTIPAIGDAGDETDSADEEERCELYPQTLTSFYDPDFKGDISERCTSLWSKYACDPKQIANLEKKTVSQAVCPLWFEHRKGRITGTKVHQITHKRESTDPSKLIRRIMGYAATDISNLKAVKWGTDNEAVARKLYVQKVSNSHTEFNCQESGFLIDQHYPFLGVSADGVVSCSCCGKGIIEVKCPHSHSDVDIATAAARDKQFMLDDMLNLKVQHPYYTQVQIGMHVHKVMYCDFIVWTPLDIHVQRVNYNAAFCEQAVSTCKDFFMDHILPEIVTRKMDELLDASELPPTAVSSADDDAGIWCICRGLAYGRMIGCDNTDCSVQWCHYACVNVRRKPRGKWFCPECSGER